MCVAVLGIKWKEAHPFPGESFGFGVNLQHFCTTYEFIIQIFFYVPHLSSCSILFFIR